MVPRANIFHNILAACRHPDVSEQFVIFNDDFFVTAPVTDVEIHYRSTLREHMNLPSLRTRKSWWSDSLTTTMACLQTLGIPDPISYELHIPFPVDKKLMRATLERFESVTPNNPPQWRTLYGNLNNIGGTVAKDSKVMSQGVLRMPYHSTTDVSWRFFRRRFMQMFPEPSRYERAVNPTRARLHA